MLCKPHFQRFIAVSRAPTQRRQQSGVHGVVHTPDCCPGAAPRTTGAGNQRELHMKLNCFSDGAMVGTAQAFAILSAEVLDEVRCPWDTKPERLPTGTTLSFPSLAPLLGFSPPDGVSRLSWLFPTSPFLGESLRYHLPPTWKDTDPLCLPRQRRGDAAPKAHLEAHQRPYRLYTAKDLVQASGTNDSVKNLDHNSRRWCGPYWTTRNSNSEAPVFINTTEGCYLSLSYDCWTTDDGPSARSLLSQSVNNYRQDISS